MGIIISSIRIPAYGKERSGAHVHEDMPVTGISALEILGFQTDHVSRQLRPRDYFFL
jgi:hypothetical protein